MVLSHLSTRFLIGEITSHRAAMKVNAQVASKVSGSEGRARNRGAKAASDAPLMFIGTAVRDPKTTFGPSVRGWPTF